MYDPGYENDLGWYVTKHCPPPDLAGYSERIERMTMEMDSLLDTGTALPPDRAVECGIRILKEFGMALFLDRDPLMSGLKDFILRLIGRLQNCISQWPYAAAPRKQLERLLVKGIIPKKTQGKKRSWQPEGVKTQYYEILFRLYHVRHLLARKEPKLSHSEKVKTAWHRFGMPIDTVRELWNLDQNDQPKQRPIPLKEMARILTARLFNIKQQTVSNLLARQNPL